MNTEQFNAGQLLNERDRLLEERIQILEARELLNERERVMNVEEKIINEKFEKILDEENFDKNYVKIDDINSNPLILKCSYYHCNYETVLLETLINHERCHETATKEKISAKTPEEIRMDQPITIDLLKKIFGTWIKTETNLLSEYIEFIYRNNSNRKDAIDWDIVTKDENLTHAVMEEFIGRLNWRWFSQYGRIYTGFSEIINNAITWSIVYQRPGLSKEIIKKIVPKISDNDMKKYIELKGDHAWYYLKKCPNLSKSFLNRFKESFINYQFYIGSKNVIDIFEELLVKLPDVNPRLNLASK